MEQTVAVRTQLRDISYLLQKLIDKYNPLQIHCFHRHEQSKKVEGCFGSVQDSGYCDYWLLMVTEGISRIESAVQDFTNAHYEFGKVIILAHGKEGIDRSINEGYRFFANVFSTGKLLYSREFYIHLLIPLEPVLVAHQERSERRYAEGMSRARGFLHGAIECLATKEYNVCAFMLHQAVEQCCIALIGLHMDYRCDIHNLYRLLLLCRCFSEVPYELFITGREEDRVVFEKLVKSYSNARYGMDFRIEEGEIDLLMERVSSLLKFDKCKRMFF
jgi:HEPN domain-containing protein